MPKPIRTQQRKNGITLRTRQGTPIAGESDPRNSVAFGADNVASGSGATFLAAPGAGKQWVITSLVISVDSVAGAGVRVSFTGGLAAVFAIPSGATSPSPAPAQLITQPMAVAVNTSFGCSSTATGTGTLHYSVSGTAYKATVPTITNPDLAQVIATSIDSDPAADLG